MKKKKINNEDIKGWVRDCLITKYTLNKSKTLHYKLALFSSSHKVIKHDI